MKNKEVNIKFRIWFNSNGEKLLGKGRVELLELIKESGSISSAATEMKMSYRQAWQMVKEMNERANEPLVEKHMGGKSGGGSYLTEAGEKAIKSFHELEQKVKIFIDSEAKKIEF